MTELACEIDPNALSPEDLDFVKKAFKKGLNAQIVGLMRSIGTSGYASIVARVTIVDIIWNTLDQARSLLAPNKDFQTWERYSQKVTFTRENSQIVPWKEFNGMFAIWISPVVGAFDEMLIARNTYEIWHDLARYKAVLDIYKPSTIKDARRVIVGVKNGDENILTMYCIDDEPDTIIQKVKAAAGDKYGCRSGMARTGRKTVDPRAKAWEKFSEGAWGCLMSKMEPKVLIDHIKSLTKTKEFVSQTQ